jgi:hypothetical protein
MEGEDGREDMTIHRRGEWFRSKMARRGRRD